MTNVKFDLYAGHYDPTHRIGYVEPTTVAEGVYGHFEDTFNAPERNVGSLSERERVGRFKITMKSSSTLSTLLGKTGGVYVRIVAKKHPDTKAWVAVDGKEQYIVKFISPIMSAGRRITLSLTSEDNQS